jgi:Predicted membrane protein
MAVHAWQVLIAVGLAADAFAVALANGARYSRPPGPLLALAVGAGFGFFQGAMLVLGHGAGRVLHRLLHLLGHWVGPAVVIAIGLHMLLGDQAAAEDRAGTRSLRVSILLLQAVATSMDAFAVGGGLAGRIEAVFPLAAMVGGVTACLCGAGVLLGRRFGARFPQKSGWVGGALLLIAGLGMLI